MNTKEVKNVVASVLARLRNTSKSNGVPFQQVLQQYAMERFLYRVSKSRHAQSVILKGNAFKSKNDQLRPCLVQTRTNSSVTLPT